MLRILSILIWLAALPALAAGPYGDYDPVDFGPVLCDAQNIVLLHLHPPGPSHILVWGHLNINPTLSCSPFYPESLKPWLPAGERRKKLNYHRQMSVGFE